MQEYTALYRKLRSRSFFEMAGQEAIIKTLKNQIAQNRISHAYLFCGIRGTGKTTAARIVSRAVNCQNPQDGEPCNECAMCLEILSEKSMDVIEIDAASHTGVDNMRVLIEECHYMPIKAKYKIYIIDESHMLSISAFNALLKTLEEPPEHVIFILATTDPQKMPPTILSRCQRFDFKRIKTGDIIKHLTQYIDAAALRVSKDAIEKIALVSDGAMRDAVNMLDQCIGFYENTEITQSMVNDLIGATDSAVFFELTGAIFSRDAQKCMSVINEAFFSGRDTGFFVSECLTHFRNVLIAQTVTDNPPIDASEAMVARYKEQAGRVSREALTYYINVFSELFSKMKYMPDERIMLEVCCVKLMYPTVREGFDALSARLSQIENALSGIQNAAPRALYETYEADSPSVSNESALLRETNPASPQSIASEETLQTPETPPPAQAPKPTDGGKAAEKNANACHGQTSLEGFIDFDNIVQE